MRAKWITKVIYLNKYTTWKTKEEIIEAFENIKINALMIRDLRNIL
jgi:hypothetical protein